MKAQAAALHAIVAFATTGHTMLQPPQLLGLVCGSTHSAPQATGAPAVHPFVHWNEGPEGAQSGAAAAHTALQVPQVVAFERSTSQPSTLLALQSEYPGSQAVTTQVRPWHPIVLWVDGHDVQLGLPHP